MAKTKIFSNQVRILRGPTNNQKNVLAIFDSNNKLLWEAPRKPEDVYYKIGSDTTYQYTFNTEEGKFNSDRYLLNHKFDHTKLIPVPTPTVDYNWYPGTVEINNSTMTVQRWDSMDTFTIKLPSAMVNFNPDAVWLSQDGWFYSNGNIQYKYVDWNTDHSSFKPVKHLDINGNTFIPDPSQMWMRNGVLHQGNNYKYIFVQGTGYVWTSSGIETISGFDANLIWTDGDDTFYGTDRILNKDTLNWEPFTMNIQVSPNDIWTDGRYLYANMTNNGGNPSTYLKWHRYEKKWVEISKPFGNLIFTINSMNYLWTDHRDSPGTHGGYGFNSPRLDAVVGFKLNGRSTTFTMQYKVWGVNNG